MKNTDLTKGPVMRSMLIFAIPMILGNLLQQGYNIADTMIVSWYLGSDALAAVGSSFTLMTFITSILLGLCMGSGAVFSLYFGKQNEKRLKESVRASFVLIAILAVVLNIIAYLCLDGIQVFLRVSDENIWFMMKEYLAIIFSGIFATFLYNYFACYLKAIGDSVSPLIFLAVSAILNIGLDIAFVAGLNQGVAGAAFATVISQYVSGIGLGIFALIRNPLLRPRKEELSISRERVKEIANYSILTCVQQSVMNLGILLVQGQVNSFGSVVMAAFAAAVKIDAFAYMPVQEFGNAFSTFIAQNMGAKDYKRIQKGFKGALITSILFSIVISIIVCVFGSQLMGLFIKSEETEIIEEGVRYLRIEGAFYFAIGILFLLYGLYRGIEKPGMSVVLTVISLGLRVALSYLLPMIPVFGVVGIWWSIPIGWLTADVVGFIYYFLRKKKLLPQKKETASLNEEV